MNDYQALIDLFIPEDKAVDHDDRFYHGRPSDYDSCYYIHAFGDAAIEIQIDESYVNGPIVCITYPSKLYHRCRYNHIWPKSAYQIGQLLSKLSPSKNASLELMCKLGLHVCLKGKIGVND